MANIVKIRNSGTSLAQPSSLEYGEIAINYNDGKLFYKNSSNQIVSFGLVDSLSTLSDVSISNLSDGQILSYNAGSGEWLNSSVGFLPEGGSRGQILTKTDSSDYNTEWTDIISGDGGSPSSYLRVYVAMDAGGV